MPEDAAVEVAWEKFCRLVWDRSVPSQYAEDVLSPLQKYDEEAWETILWYYGLMDGTAYGPKEVAARMNTTPTRVDYLRAKARAFLRRFWT